MSGLWREMKAEYFGTSDPEKLKYYDEIIEGYGMLRGLYVASIFIDTATFDVLQRPMMRKCVDYLSVNGLKPLEDL